MAQGNDWVGTGLSLEGLTARMAFFSLLPLMGLALALPPDFQRTAWVTGLPGTPTKMEFAPDGRLFVAGDDASVRVIKNGKLLPTPFVIAPAEKKGGSIRGMALDPDFPGNGYVYLFYAHPLATGGNEQRITRFKTSAANPDVAEAGSEQVILDRIAGNGHLGGGLFFGRDGMLYAATGSPGSQDLANLGGKVLRLNPSAYPAVIPTDNPFVGKAGARPEIYALGLREPFSSAVDPFTGEGYINDVGGSKFEEVNRIVKGANYGYPDCEGVCGNGKFENPWGNWAHAGGSCIAGGTFYRGDRFPAKYQGTYFASDETRKRIVWRNAAGSFADWETTEGSVTDMRVGPDGALYWADRGRKTIYRTIYTGPTGLAVSGSASATALLESKRGAHRTSAPGARFRLGTGSWREARGKVLAH